MRVLPRPFYNSGRYSKCIGRYPLVSVDPGLIVCFPLLFSPSLFQLEVLAWFQSLQSPLFSNHSFFLHFFFPSFTLPFPSFFHPPLISSSPFPCLPSFFLSYSLPIPCPTPHSSSLYISPGFFLLFTLLSLCRSSLPPFSPFNNFLSFPIYFTSLPRGLLIKKIKAEQCKS